MIFNFNEEQLRKNKGIYTLTEIAQQPKIWTEVLTIVENRQIEIAQFLTKNLTKTTKIVMVGAGTSEFAGNSLYPQLIKLGFDAVSVATTDIVTNPEHFLNPNQETLLISFARSGNSPESVATYNMVNQFVKKTHNLVITCNKDGELAKSAQTSENNFVFLLPDAANDQSFAMTSSFTGMMVACWLILDLENLVMNKKNLLQTIQDISQSMELNYVTLQEVANLNQERIVFLGSGVLKGISQEAHLKVLELTAGAVTTFFNTPVGFRHGPKSILNKKTIAFILMNQNSYARKYDEDLLRELSSQKQLDKIVVLDSKQDPSIENLIDYYLVSDLKITDDFLLGLNYIVQCQIYAFYKSLFLEKTPDNPWPSGLVNRVVQGVVIHEIEE